MCVWRCLKSVLAYLDAKNSSCEMGHNEFQIVGEKWPDFSRCKIGTVQCT